VAAEYAAFLADAPNPRSYQAAGRWTKIRVYVKFLIVGDGAGRRSLLGLPSAASTYPSVYSSIHKSLCRNLRIFAPVTHTAEEMRAREPTGDAATSHKKRMAHVRKKCGVYGHNITGADATDCPPDAFHQFLLSLPRILSWTFRAVQADPTSDSDDFERHIRECCKLKFKIAHVEMDGRVVLTLYGNDCRCLLLHLDKLLSCPQCHCEFMSLPEQREAIMLVFTAFHVVLADLRCTVLADCLSPADSFVAVNIALELAVAVFGSKFVTPTLREMRDNNPHFKLKLSQLGLGYTLADVGMDGFEAHNKRQKLKFSRGIKGGGRGEPTDPIKNLLVAPPLLFCPLHGTYPFHFDRTPTLSLYFIRCITCGR
jgi:hypothetical protein